MFKCFCFAGVCSDIRLDQSPSQAKRPADTIKLSCSIFVYSMTRSAIHWIRQKPGKVLEWIGRMKNGSGTDVIHADSLKSLFILTEDVSTSTQFLEAKSLRAEDSAVYYCAQQTLTGDGEAVIQKPQHRLTIWLAGVLLPLFVSQCKTLSSFIVPPELSLHTPGPHILD
uniref:Ig-like domain-containing protein n=1 Tax=Oncorhynchus kisutch TaxID=8019 RepID=A0A8C7K5D2_ONCKI